MVSSTVLTICVCFLFQHACNFNSTDRVPGAHDCHLILIYRPNASTSMSSVPYIFFMCLLKVVIADFQKIGIGTIRAVHFLTQLP